MKGAPEYVIPISKSVFNNRYEEVEWNDQTSTINDIKTIPVLEDIVVNKMCRNGLKCLSYAYRVMPKYELNNLMDNFDPESENFLDELIHDMVYLATFGLEDKVRVFKGEEGVAETIKMIRFGTVD